MKFLLTGLSLFLISCGSDLPSPDPTPPPQVEEEDLKDARVYRTLNELNQTLSQRLMQDKSPVQLEVHLLADDYDSQSSIGFENNLAGLLPQTVLLGSESKSINLTPNPVNALLWYLIFTDFSSDFVESMCGSNHSQEYGLITWNSLSLTVQKQSTEFCDLSRMTPTEQDATLKSLWVTLVNFDAPESEMQSWIEFSKAEVGKPQSNQDTLKTIVVAALYNPYVLFAR